MTLRKIEGVFFLVYDLWLFLQFAISFSFFFFFLKIWLYQCSHPRVCSTILNIFTSPQTMIALSLSFFFLLFLVSTIAEVPHHGG